MIAEVYLNNLNTTFFWVSVSVWQQFPLWLQHGEKYESWQHVVPAWGTDRAVARAFLLSQVAIKCARLNMVIVVGRKIPHSPCVSYTHVGKGESSICLLYLLYIQFWTRIEPQKLADIQCFQSSVLVKWKGNNVSTLVVLNGISSYGKFLSCWIFCSKVEILPGNGGNGNFVAIFNLTCYKCVAWEFVIVLEFQVPLLIHLLFYCYPSWSFSWLCNYPLKKKRVCSNSKTLRNSNSGLGKCGWKGCWIYSSPLFCPHSPLPSPIFFAFLTVFVS